MSTCSMGSSVPVAVTFRTRSPLRRREVAGEGDPEQAADGQHAEQQPAVDREDAVVGEVESQVASRRRVDPVVHLQAASVAQPPPRDR
jgi:hypothetical protein